MPSFSVFFFSLSTPNSFPGDDVLGDANDDDDDVQGRRGLVLVYRASLKDARLSPGVVYERRL